MSLIWNFVDIAKCRLAHVKVVLERDYCKKKPTKFHNG